MKKVILIFTAVLSITSCTENQNSEKQIQTTYDSAEAETLTFKLTETKDWQLNDSLHSRALYVINDKELFVGSYAGRLLKLTTEDTNSLITPLMSFENLEDIRGIQLIKEDIYGINSGSKGTLIKSKINGLEVENVFTKKGNYFFNGLLFWNENEGIIFGDPKKGRLTIISKIANDNIWSSKIGPKTLPNEAGFSASNTAMCIRPKGKVWIGTGGDSIARVHYSSDYGVNWTTFNTPLMSNESSGIFSIHFYDDLNGVAVGGSWLNPDSTDRISTITVDGGKTWETTKGLRGYRSCVASNGKLTIACGRNGADYSLDQGKTWKPLFDEAFYTVVVKDNYAWFSGKDGAFRKITFNL